MSATRDGRDRVLRHARALFIERGFADVSMQEIAEAAGLRKASIYHHFRDKQDLFSQIVVLEMRALRRAMEEQIARGGPLQTQLEALACAQFEQFGSSDVERLARDFRQHVPEEFHDDVHQELESLQQVFDGVFEQAAAAGEIRDVDPRVVGLLFFHMVAAWAWHSLDDPSLMRPDPRTGARTVTAILLHGIATAPPDCGHGSPR